MVFLAGGHPDTSIFGEETLREMASAVVGDGAAALQYGSTDGTGVMRETVAEVMTAEGTPVGAEHVAVTSGAQQGLDLAGRAFLEEGDLVLIESPTYHGALQAFSSYGPRVMTAPVDRRGLDVEAVREILSHERRAGYRAKFIYVVPTFQNPTGATMALERRRELLEIAREHDALILEDNPYGLLRYEGDAVPTLAALEMRERGGPERVVYLGSFSKVFAPGVRLGWIHAHPEILGAMRAARKGADLGPSVLSQTVTAAYFASGEWKTYLGRLGRRYRKRRDAVLGALGEFMPEGVSWTSPSGGFFVWVTLPQGIDAAGMLPEATERGVAYVPGADFYPGGWGGTEGRNALRLSFSFAEPRLARRGVEILAGLVREKMGDNETGPPACGCGSDVCSCAPGYSCTEAVVGVVAC
ncbi:aminotransferase class I/II-fold pyridoxal phosphate-dependent enzyme [Rubrobacter tropicus]|uniref:Aminotransferase class I/II-fold pyridoxal phosphate-dependent enzyme n=1 Tax=Rubrobacter tropicus TaxID=2653851 RepID=A0A6G8QDD2_9ACTN|nr:PLP-dependent aminotransferase family protein [Rubrobacter tropicus]QIN84489.1 aminotransferase class I/II-fold pyridoxal phosphate-dependent enzyme [Rubrobacter tropicus]